MHLLRSRMSHILFALGLAGCLSANLLPPGALGLVPARVTETALVDACSGCASTFSLGQPHNGGQPTDCLVVISATVANYDGDCFFTSAGGFCVWSPCAPELQVTARFFPSFARMWNSRATATTAFCEGPEVKTDIAVGSPIVIIEQFVEVGCGEDCLWSARVDAPWGAWGTLRCSACSEG